MPRASHIHKTIPYLPTKTTANKTEVDQGPGKTKLGKTDLRTLSQHNVLPLSLIVASLVLAILLCGRRKQRRRRHQRSTGTTPAVAKQHSSARAAGNAATSAAAARAWERLLLTGRIRALQHKKDRAAPLVLVHEAGVLEV
eukprot:359833-Chlamydomonas_euryale.AAC.20